LYNAWNHTYGKENTVALVAATKEIGLEVTADKTKYVIMSGVQTARLGHIIEVEKVQLKRWKS
jgi:hypothetical protein